MPMMAEATEGSGPAPRVEGASDAPSMSDAEISGRPGEGALSTSGAAASNPASPQTLSSWSELEDELEGDVCRICRCGGEADNPLFYPCACSGSIKFVHQDCLLQWLNHSGARNCEVRSPFPPRARPSNTRPKEHGRGSAYGVS